MTRKVKVCLIGDPAVGKTSLIRRFVYSRFDDDYISSLGTKVSQKNMDFKDNRGQPLEVMMMIWDIAGQREFQSILMSGLKGSKGVFLVADLTRMDTIEHLDHWFDSIQKAAPQAHIVFLANKSDLPDQVFSNEDLESTLKNKVSTIMLTSAKDGSNVEEAFRYMGRITLEEKKSSNEMPATQSPKEEQGSRMMKLEDRLIQNFCDYLGDDELGMNIVRKQFDALHIDFRDPSEAELKKLSNKLLEVAKDFKDPQSLARYKQKQFKILEEYFGIKE